MSDVNSIGVLYANFVDSEKYHILKANSNHHYHNGEVYHYAIVHDRRADGEMWVMLYEVMQRLKLDVLWVMPDTQLSLWINRADFNSIEGLKWFSPIKTGVDRYPRPSGVRLGYDKYVFFPAYMENVRVHRDSDMWNIPLPMDLYDTVEYIQRSLNTPYMWSPGATAMKILRDSIPESKIIKPFTGGAMWDSAIKKMVTRPMWSHRLPDGKRGLPLDTHIGTWYVHGVDKIRQYLGACVGTVFGNGEYTEVTGYAYRSSIGDIGFWEYELNDVSQSAFNGFTCYCPLSIRDNWASSQLLYFADSVGIKFTVKRGMVWQDRAGKVLDKWATKMWESSKELEDDRTYTNRIASHNAEQTEKKMYLDMIGRFCKPFSKEFYHRDWNMTIVHQAIARQGYSISKRIREHNDAFRIVLTSNDSFYWLSRSPSIDASIPDLLVHADKLRGYRAIGSCELSKDIIAAFHEEKSIIKIESVIKERMSQYVTSK